MSIDEDDELFTLGTPDEPATVERATLVRQAVAAVVLLVAAAGAAWLLPAVLSDGPPQSDDSVLLADGETRSAQTSAERTSMLWFDESLVDPTCVITDGESGAELGLTPTDGSERRALGSAGSWVGAATFEPTSESVDVTCTDAPGASVLISQAPGGTPGLIAIGAIVLVPLTLALAGLVLVVAVATALVQVRFGRRS